MVKDINFSVKYNTIKQKIKFISKYICIHWYKKSGLCIKRDIILARTIQNVLTHYFCSAKFLQPELYVYFASSPRQLFIYIIIKQNAP